MFSLTFVVFVLTALWVPHRCPDAHQHHSTGNAHKNLAKSYYSEPCSSDTEMEARKDRSNFITKPLPERPQLSGAGWGFLLSCVAVSLFFCSNEGTGVGGDLRRVSVMNV